MPIEAKILASPAADATMTPGNAPTLCKSTKQDHRRVSAGPRRQDQPSSSWKVKLYSTGRPLQAARVPKRCPQEGKATPKVPPSSDPVAPDLGFPHGTTEREVGESQQRRLQQGNDARGRHHRRLRSRSPDLTGHHPHLQILRAMTRSGHDEHTQDPSPYPDPPRSPPARARPPDLPLCK